MAPKGVFGKGGVWLRDPGLFLAELKQKRICWQLDRNFELVSRK